jgi:SAM-dependent methyltransferase
MSMPDLWRMVRCELCASIWLDPRPDAVSLARAYDDYYTHDAEVEEIPREGASGAAWSLIHAYLNARFGMHKVPAIQIGAWLFRLVEPWRLKLDYYGRHLTRKHFPGRGRLLDIGCGNGAFLVRAHDMGWHAEGCEVDPKAVEACRQLGLEVKQGDAFDESYETGSFDMITMSHVIEHVVDQEALLRRIYALLKPGGWFWMALPNPQSMGLRVFGAAWQALHPPYHLSIPSQVVLRRWLNDSKFAEIAFLRRGAHARRVWGVSHAIGARNGIAVRTGPLCYGVRVATDMLATITPRWSEETVVMARRPVELAHD